MFVLEIFCLCYEISWLICHAWILTFSLLILVQELRSCSREHGQASSRFDYVPEAARNCYWTTMWEMWWKVCNMWFLCAPLHTCSSLWWMPTMDPFKVAVLFVEEWVFLMPTIAKSVHSRRKIGMDVQKLSI